MSNVNNITKAIKGYIESQITHYAIHMSGGWGQGKSHYITHTLIPELSKPAKSTDAKSQSKPKPEYTCVYISLFGLSTRQDIENAILGVFASMADNEYLTALKEVSKAFSTDQDGVKITGGSASALISGVFSVLRAKKLKKELDSVNGIFFFDDLERFGGNISIPMAFMSNVIEVGNSKCVVLCNENNFLENPDSSKKQFNLFKEKVIGRTVRFAYEEEEFIDILLQISETERDSELHELLRFCIGRLDVALHIINKEKREKHNAEYLKKYDPHYLFCDENGHRKNIRSCQKALMLLEELLKTKRHFLFNNPFRVLSIFILTLDMLDQQTHPEKYENIIPRPISRFVFHDAQKEDDELVQLWLSEGYLSQIKIDNLFIDWSPCEIINYLIRSNHVNIVRNRFFNDSTIIESILPKLREIAKNVRLGFPWSLRDTLLVFEWGLFESRYSIQEDRNECLDVTMNIFECAWGNVKNDLVLIKNYHWSWLTIKNWKVEAELEDLEDWKSFEILIRTLTPRDGDELDSFQTKLRDDCYPRFKRVVDALN
jgi:hypothetical protein